jgi:hypothetical protein
MPQELVIYLEDDYSVKKMELRILRIILEKVNFWTPLILGILQYTYKGENGKIL